MADSSNDTTLLSVRDNFDVCWHDADLNRQMQEANMTFTLLIFILTTLFAAGINSQKTDALPNLSSFLWFLSSIIYSCNRLYLMTDIFTQEQSAIIADILAFVLDYAARVSLLLFLAYKIKRNKTESSIVNYVLGGCVVLLGAFAAAAYGMAQQTKTTYLAVYMGLDSLATLGLEFYLISLLTATQSGFDFYQAITSLVLGDLTAIGSIVILLTGNDLFGVYYYGMFAGKIIMYQVFNARTAVKPEFPDGSSNRSKG